MWLVIKIITKLVILADHIECGLSDDSSAVHHVGELVTEFKQADLLLLLF